MHSPHRRRLAPAALLLAVSTAALAADRLPESTTVAPVEVLCTRDYSEGVVLDRDGSLFFSHGKVISRVSPDGRMTDWHVGGAPNGHKILPNGNHLVCDGDRHAVLELDPQGKEVRVAAGAWDGTPLNAPNDLTLDPKGGFYFTDPGGSGASRPIGSVYYVSPAGEVRRFATGFAFPNGIALSADRKKLYVAESERNRILVWDLKSPGVPKGEYRVFAELPGPDRPGSPAVPDGIAFDRDGRLWVAHFGTRKVRVLDRRGRLVASYSAGNRLTSNLCFAGKRLDRLYVTGGEPGCLYRLDVGVRGLSLLKR